MTVIPKLEELPEDLRAKQVSCINCAHCRGSRDINFDFNSVNTWACRAPDNLISERNPVTGEFIAKIDFCKDIRKIYLLCPWHKPRGYWYPNLNYKTIYQLNKEESLASSSKRLSATTLDDI